jgi:hypothetical protein
MTGLQSEPFDVNLYVFYRYWLNDRLSPFGYVHRGFRLKHRDWDTPKCEANAGKAYSSPEDDPYLADLASHILGVKTFFQKRYPGERFYLTNIQARGLKPADVREWVDDFWLFPYYRAYLNIKSTGATSGQDDSLYASTGSDSDIDGQPASSDWRR